MTATPIVKTNTPKIYAALAGVMAEVGAIYKKDTSIAGSSSFKFRGIDTVVNAVYPALINWGVVIFPSVVPGSRQVTERLSKQGAKMIGFAIDVRYLWVCVEDGSWHECVVTAYADDTADKAMGKVMSLAYRTAILQTLCLPTDDKEPDADVHESPTEKELAELANKQASLLQTASDTLGAITNRDTLTDFWNNRRRDFAELSGESILQLTKMVTTRGAELAAVEASEGTVIVSGVKAPEREEKPLTPAQAAAVASWGTEPFGSEPAE
jgi:hypothetical protein